MSWYQMSDLAQVDIHLVIRKKKKWLLALVVGRQFDEISWMWDGLCGLHSILGPDFKSV